MKLMVCTSTMRPPRCISPARATSSPGEVMGTPGMALRNSAPISGFRAGKVCMPSTIPVSSNFRNTLSMVLVGDPPVKLGKM